MRYTNETLHGLIYQHRAGGPTYRIIQVHDNKEFSHTTCKILDGITTGPWITLEAACKWIEDGVWILQNQFALQEQSSKIINQYEIY